MPNVPYPYENGKFVGGNGSLIPISSLSKRSLLPSLTVVPSSTVQAVHAVVNEHPVLGLRGLAKIRKNQIGSTQIINNQNRISEGFPSFM